MQSGPSNPIEFFKNFFGIDGIKDYVCDHVRACLVNLLCLRLVTYLSLISLLLVWTLAQ